MTKVLHHNDNDGRCAAALIAAYLGRTSIVPKDFFEVDYNVDIDSIIHKVEKDETVWIVDFSLQPEMMTKLLDITSKVIWIDHHKSAIEKYKDFKLPEHLVTDMNNGEIAGIRSVEKSGCELTAEYIAMCSGGDLFKETPEFVKLVGDYDTWQFKYGLATEYFYYGVSVIGAGLWQVWPKLILKGVTVEEVKNAGFFIHSYLQNQYKELAKRGVYPIEFHGYKGIALNTAQLGSKQFEVIQGVKDVDIMVPFFWNGKQWRVGVYSTNPHIDCSAICTQYGGGGHKAAAGFFTDNIPHELFESTGETVEV